MLIEIYLRARDNSAVISFLHGVDAQAFYEHARRNDLYIKDQRVRHPETFPQDIFFCKSR